VARANPSRQFAIVDANPNVPNIYPMQFDTAQASFVAGYLAAGYSKTGKVGTYGGLKIPPVTVFMDGFADGVAYYNLRKGAKVVLLGWDKTTQDGLFTNDFASTVKGEQASDALAAQGADVIMPVADFTGDEITGEGTTRDAATGRFSAIWVDTDGCVSTADCAGILTSVEKNISDAVRDSVLRGARRESLALSDSAIGTLANGGVALAPYHTFDGRIDPSLKAEIEQIKADIASGKIMVTSTASPTK
jgi:basic membrane protein A